MKNTILIAFLLGSLTYSCTPHYSETNPAFDFSQKIRSENKMILAKKGLVYQKPSGLFPPPENKIWDRYTTTKYHFTSVDDARILFCDTFEEYIKPFNEDQTIQKDFPEFTATYKNVELMIKFYDKDHHILQSPYICNVYNEEGFIVYTVFNVKEKRMSIVHKEPFETGFNIYKQIKKDSI